jgi:superfamily II DNA or RNA helicase
MSYADFLATKRRVHQSAGLNVDRADLHPDLFEHQRDITAWALRKGRAAIFADCGVGKTLCELEYGTRVPGNALLLAPLAVGHQTEREARRFGYDAHVSDDGRPAGKVTIINYEKLHKVCAADYSAVIADESSILKSLDGKTKTQLIEMFAPTPYRLACTATPAPNDHMELGNHAEFLGVCTKTEMLATYFCHDGGETQTWRLKGHAVKDFWAWVASWAVMVRRPSDLGYSDDGFVLPPLNFHVHEVESGLKTDGELFTMPMLGMNEQRSARRHTLDMRVAKAAEIANAADGQVIVWCELNDESDALDRAIIGSTSVSGSDSDERKTQILNEFAEGHVRVLTTKPKIAAHGMNFQNAHVMVFVGLTHSYEQFYQAVRREWRYGQTQPVDVHIVTSDAERAILENIQEKQAKADEMAAQMVEMMSETTRREIQQATEKTALAYAERSMSGDGWTMFNGDCVDVVSKLPSESIGFSVFSPPFASLYVYSDSDRDMGNCRTHGEFYAHFEFLIRELYRVTMSGRLVSFHCMNLPTSKERDGFIGISDFRGDLIRLFQAAGWIFHSEVVIWKDPVTAMQRTKALGLLHKQIKKDSCMSRQGIPDYLVTMRKPGVNPDPVSHTAAEFPVQLWQQYASPIWMDINPSDTLQYMSAREHNDERHICPLQLQVIERALHLWSKPGDVVLSPFAGIGSEGHCAVKMGREFVGVELKKSYYEQATRNLQAAGAQLGLFSTGT